MSIEFVTVALYINTKAFDRECVTKLIECNFGFGRPYPFRIERIKPLLQVVEERMNELSKFALMRNETSEKVGHYIQEEFQYLLESAVCPEQKQSCGLLPCRPSVVVVYHKTIISSKYSSIFMALSTIHFACFCSLRSFKAIYINYSYLQMRS